MQRNRSLFKFVILAASFVCFALTTRGTVTASSIDALNYYSATARITTTTRANDNGNVVPNDIAASTRDSPVEAHGSDVTMSLSDELSTFPFSLWTRKRHTLFRFTSNGTSSLYSKGLNTRRRDEETPDEGNASEATSELSTEVAYEDIYDTLIFLAMIFIFGKAATMIGMPSLVGEIICGFLFGPPLAKYVPFPNAIVLIGEIGLIMLLLEAGIDVDVAQLKETGIRSVAIAVTGSILPLLVGLGISMASGSSLQTSGMNFRTAIAVGACFSPTSLGVASNALSSGRMLNTPVGQLIVAACVLDDILGLIILSVLEVLNAQDAELWEYFVPVISSFGFLIFLGWCALTWLPKVIEYRIMPLFPESQRDLVAFALMFVLLLAYLPLLYYTRASYLTGAFLAGLSFSQIHTVHKTFVHQTQNLMKWLLRIFFAASIGFQVPITTFWTPSIIGWGTALYLCVMAKLPLGLYVPNLHMNMPKEFPFDPWKRDAIITGLAMTCRGEFSFIIASFSLGDGLFDEDTYSAVVWAILLSCVTSPFILLFVVKYYNSQSKASLEAIQVSRGVVPLHLVVQCRCKIAWGLQDKLSKCAAELGLSIIDQRSWHPRGYDAIVVSELFVEDQKTKVVVRDSDEEQGKERLNQEEIILARCAEVEKTILREIAQISAKVQVTQWLPNVLSEGGDDLDEGGVSTHIVKEAREKLDRDETIDTLLEEVPTRKEKRAKMLSGPIAMPKEEEGIEEEMESDEESSVFMPGIPEEKPTPSVPTSTMPRRRRRHKTLSVPAFAANNMWDQDSEVQNLAMTSSYVPTVTYDLSTPSYGQATRRRQVSDLSTLLDQSMLPSVEEHLEGFVRFQLNDDNDKKK
jgi:Kef-type K+ transport system membrane component KefB